MSGLIHMLLNGIARVAGVTIKVVSIESGLKFTLVS